MGNYFIRITDGVDVRRTILETSKSSLHMLRSYQQLIVLRGRKLATIAQLRRDLKEITVLLNRAESLLPQLSAQELAEFARHEPLPEVETVRKKEPRPAVRPERPDTPAQPKEVYVGVDMKKPVETPNTPKRKLTEAERLEEALRRVEEQLGKL